MGWAKKKVKKVTKSVKKVAKTVTKVVKKVAKPIVKVVKKVAKSIVNVGKKIVSGIKGVVKSVGKTLGKLGPLASIALMAIPGFQGFAVGLANSMGFTSAIAGKMASGALAGFVTSGGSLKGALMGGAMAGAGSYLGDVASGVFDGQGFGASISNANALAMAPSSIQPLSFTQAVGKTGDAIKNFSLTDTINDVTTGVSNTFNGIQEGASKMWGNFTDGVGEFFGSQAPTGSIAEGAGSYMSTMDKYGMSVSEYMNVYGKVPDTAIGMTGESYNALVDGGWTQESLTKAGVDMTQQAKILAEQNAAFASDTTFNQYGMSPSEVAETYGADVLKMPNTADSNFVDMMQQSTPTEIGSLYDANHPMFNAPEADQQAFKAQMTASGIDINSQQAKMMAEQQFADTVNMTKNELGEWNYNTYNTVDPTLVMNTPEEYRLFTEAGESGVIPTPTKSKSLDLKSLLSGNDSTSSSPFIAGKDVGKGITSAGSTSSFGGTGGMLGYTDIQRQTQAQLIAQAESQAEEARKRAQAGWGVA
jgi:hypothetical protein